MLKMCPSSVPALTLLFEPVWPFFHDQFKIKSPYYPSDVSDRAFDQLNAFIGLAIHYLIIRHHQNLY
jgi:hypothetical protein